MRNRTRKNYLRTYRKKLGLNERQLAFLLGLKSSARISAMELGQAVPTARECIALRLLFAQSFEKLWPRVALGVEATTVTNIRRLIARLRRRHKSVRKQIRLGVLRKNLSNVLARIRKNNLTNLT